MTKTNTESGVFINSLKKLGILIENEDKVRERLGEAASWKYAFNTLVNNGKLIGIKFMRDASSQQFRRTRLHRVCERFAIPEKTENALLNSLKSA